MGVPPTSNFGENNQGPLSNSTHPQLISNKFLPWFGLNKYYFFMGDLFKPSFAPSREGKGHPKISKNIPTKMKNWNVDSWFEIWKLVHLCRLPLQTCLAKLPRKQKLIQGPLSNSTHPQLISNKFLPWFGLNKYYFFMGDLFKPSFAPSREEKGHPKNSKNIPTKMNVDSWFEIWKLIQSMDSPFGTCSPSLCSSKPTPTSWLIWEINWHSLEFSHQHSTTNSPHLN